MTRIYTKAGDTGETSLADGSRASKSSSRINLYGEVDELNSVVGHAISVLRRSEIMETEEGRKIVSEVDAELIHIQSRLFDLGAILADPSQSKKLISLPPGEQPFNPQRLEKSMDNLDKYLAPLSSFILPGGCEAAGILHVARCVCRRVERGAVSLSASDNVPSGAIIYLNRLSDFFFTAARSVNAAAGIDDVIWEGKAASITPKPKLGD